MNSVHVSVQNIHFLGSKGQVSSPSVYAVYDGGFMVPNGEVLRGVISVTWTSQYRHLSSEVRQ